MISREQGSLWPMLTVGIATAAVVLIPTFLQSRHHSSQMATVDPDVSIGDQGVPSTSLSSTPSYKWPDTEVPRTAERLRDVTAVTVAAISYVVEGEMTGHHLRDANEIVSGIAQRQLIPTEWLTNESGVLRMPQGKVHVRYSPSMLSVEVVSVPNERCDGPAILIRIPDTENTSVGPRYFESLQIDGIVYPTPFAHIAEIIASGWQPRPFKQTQFSAEERAQLEQWVSNVV